MLIFIVVLVFLLIQQSKVQTYLAQKAAVYLSDKLKTRVEIGSVEIHFFKKVVINDIYIEDLHHDTLLYAKEINVGIGDINLKQHKLNIRDVVLLNTTAKIIKYKADDDLNMQFIIDAFDSGDTTKHAPKAPWDLRVEKVTLINTDFTYRSEHDTLETTGINYFDQRSKNINGQFTGIQIDHDTIFGTINYLSAVERSGFTLKNLSSNVKISPKGIKLDGLKLKTPESDISTNLSFEFDKGRDFLKDFISKVTIKATFDHSKLEMSDIAYFAPELKGLYKSLNISGKVSGRINDLHGKNMQIMLSESTEFDGDVTLTGLPNTDETLIYLNVKKLTTNYNDLKELPIPPFAEHKKLSLPANIAKLGNMRFRGTFTGLYNDFYAYGKFSSALGDLSSDLSVRHDSAKNKEFYKGKLKSIGFDFGSFFDIKTLGKATIDVDVDGSGLTLETVTAKLKGTVNSIDFNNYTYKNVVVEGDVAKQIFNGKLNVKDDNIDFDFIGKVDFTNKLPTLDFITTLNKADLGALHFINTAKKTNISTQLVINVTGNNIDNLIGHINFDNTIYTQGNEVYKMSVFNLTSQETNGIKSIKLVSDFADAKINGKFKIMELQYAVGKVLHHYLPSHFNNIGNNKFLSEENFEYDILFKKTADVTRLFAPSIRIAANTFIKGDFNASTNKLVLDGGSDQLIFSGITLKNWTAKGSTSENQLVFNTGCDRLFFTDSLSLNDLKLTTVTQNDSVNLAINWDNKTKKQSKGDIKAFLNFSAGDVIKFKIQPSEFSVSDSVWSINKTNEVIIDSNYVTVKELMFEHGDQSIALNGVISDDKKDQIQLSLTNFNLANLNAITSPLGITLKGRIDGLSTITDLYHGFVFTSDNSFRSFYVNDNEIGNGDVESVWNEHKEALFLHGSFTLGIVPNILFSGNYYPNKEQDNLDMELNIQAMKMQIFEPFVKKYCSDLKGIFAGSLTITGSVKEPKVSGIVNVNAKKITVDYLNTSYKFSHDITVDNNSFSVEDMILSDDNNNKAVVTGKLYHTNFKDFQLDFDIRADKFMCLNTTEANNSLYYGKAFVTGVINIFGFTDNVTISANVKTDKITSNDKFNLLSKTEITKFYIPLSTTSEVSESNFITFVKKDSTIKIKDDYSVQLLGLTLDFDLNLTPDAEIQLIFDEKVGDIIKARGNGNIKLKINDLGDFKMYGDYVVESGDYLFTLKNIINKRFDIEPGGTIKWSGVPYSADLNLSAVYKTRALLKPFFPEDSTGKRVPVDLKLLMTGDLLSPDINFNIDLPTIDASRRQTVLSYVNNDAEMNRQVFSLLILNSFVTPYQLSNSGNGLAVGSAVQGNTSELLSNQLSNMLSNISKDFDVGINYRPGDAISKNELEVALSTQLFNDKLILDGNVGVNNNTNTQSTNNIVGDVNAEYKLTESGKVRIKAFNKANDNSLIYSPGTYTQGVGIFYREEFDTIGELFKRYLNKIKGKNKKEEKDDGYVSPTPGN